MNQFRAEESPGRPSIVAENGRLVQKSEATLPVGDFGLGSELIVVPTWRLGKQRGLLRFPRFSMVEPTIKSSTLASCLAVKQVVAVVKPYLAERVLESLKRAPVEALNVREVKGYGRQKSYLEEYGDSEYSLAFLPKVEIALWVDDARVDEIVKKIVAVARTGRMGDGKVLVFPVDSHADIIDIATGESESA
jgi:nitrogen regulatory protein P-II 1